MIKVDFKLKNMKFLSSFEKKQIPYAIAVSLTRLAQLSQKEIIKNFPNKYTVRSQWYKPNRKFGFRIKAASKKRFQSLVYTHAGWLELHEDGGIKEPTKASLLAVRSDNVKLTSRGKVPKKYRRSKKNFVRDGKYGPVILKRIGGKKQRKTQLLFSLKKSAKIKPTLEMEKTVSDVIEANYQKVFNTEFKKAVKNAN